MYHRYSKMIKKIAVVGAGVIGTSCALKICEHFKDNHDIQVYLLSEEFSPNTTGDGAAGLWGPYLFGDTAPNKIIKWSSISHQFFHELWTRGHAAEAGICLQPVTTLTTDPAGCYPFWSEVVFGCYQLNCEQLAQYSREHSTNYTDGVNYVTFSCEPVHYLPYLMRRFKLAGGEIFHKRVNHFDELTEEYELIINCTGLGARILANDPKMKPIRGQVTRVQAPWSFQSFLDDSHYIISNIEAVVLGGTHQENDFNKNVYEKDSKFIRKGCLNMIPTLENAPLMKHFVGLRPGRDAVRIEEDIFVRKNGKIGKLIHNYGHGGCGITLSWGCATDVLDLVKANVENGLLNVKSKF